MTQSSLLGVCKTSVSQSSRAALMRGFYKGILSLKHYVTVKPHKLLELRETWLIDAHLLPHAPFCLHLYFYSILSRLHIALL